MGKGEREREDIEVNTKVRDIQGQQACQKALLSNLFSVWLSSAKCQCQATHEATQSLFPPEADQQVLVLSLWHLPRQGQVPEGGAAASNLLCVTPRHQGVMAGGEGNNKEVWQLIYLLESPGDTHKRKRASFQCKPLYVLY